MRVNANLNPMRAGLPRIKTIDVDSFSFDAFQATFENKNKTIKIVGLHFLIILLYDVSNIKYQVIFK